MIILESHNNDYKYVEYVIKHRARVKRAWETYLKPLVKNNYLVALVDYLIEIHDLDKFENLDTRALHYNYGDTQNLSIEAPNDLDFDQVSQDHKENNGHHWEYWLVNDIPEEMPEEYVLEMLSDWASFQFVKSAKGNAHSWWEDHQSEIQVHPNTRKLINYWMDKVPSL